MGELEELKQREREKDIFAYGLAKQIADFAKTNAEVPDVIGRIKSIFSRYQRGKKPEIYSYPVNRWGEKLEMPGEESPGMNV